MNKVFLAEVLENQPLSDTVYLISLRTPFQVEAKAGQFFILRIDQRFDPLLGRPFSIFDIEGDVLKFLYRVRGRGTTLLSQIKATSKLWIHGPFGRWYPFPKDEFVVLAGGIGLGSVFYLIKRFPGKAHLFYGAKEKKEIFFIDELKGLSKTVYFTTECGSIDYRGVVTDLFNEKGLHLELPVYCCGPMAMISELKKILSKKSQPCYVAVEERMACGVGACLGCVVATEGGYKRVCTDGPVFEIRELRL